ncbi:MAG: chorismate synthase [Thermoanaerobaculum sp.]|nr:chorismate synthase [Thermoanaerobaculum sp.]
MLRLVTGGESHGPELVAILLGVPAGLPLTPEDINRELARRQHGFGRGGRQKIEKDQVEVRGGLRGGVTLGSPLVLAIPNRDFAHWVKVMDPWEADEEAAQRRRIVTPRPGHADLAGAWKFDHRQDLRNVLERASARETAARVAAGAVCKALLGRFGVVFRSGVLALGEKVLASGPPTFELLAQVRDDSPLRTPFPAAEGELVAYVEEAKHRGETLGGVVGVVARGVPPGLGSYTHWEDRLDGQLAQAVMAVPAVKGVVLGAGLEAAGRLGSQAHDPILPGVHGLRRGSNHAGGLEGGVTNGEDVVVRAFMKPIATLRNPLPSVNLHTLQGEPAAYERSDVTAIAALGVIVENVVAFVLARAFLAKFAGDHLRDVQAAFASYQQRLAGWGPEGFAPGKR